ncbi:hypothetical protein C2S51_028184 [Perilla frutescens var. frutescens]|nr:hypothetical protein C2S51_028184 [Perilla frutescens var. frutescens]
MLIHVELYTCPFMHSNPSLFSLNKSKNSKRNKALFGLKKSRRIYKAVEKDSEFEVDPDEAREALRKLDEQLQSFSTKQVGTPKFRAADYSQSSSQAEEEISGSFWAYAASLLLLFTIFYNILFITIIKPSIDGPQPVESAETYDMK